MYTQGGARQEDTLGPTSDNSGRSRREQSHGDWEKIKTVREIIKDVMNPLSDSDQNSDQQQQQQQQQQQKGHQSLLEDGGRAQTEKSSKVSGDVRKGRGRPRKSTKSPKRGSHRTSTDETTTTSAFTKTSSRSRTRTGGGGGGLGKKKQPISKERVPTSDDDSDSVTQSDSDSDRRLAAKMVPVTRGEKRSRRESVSSSDNEDCQLPASKKNNSNISIEEDAARWRRVTPIKRNSNLSSDTSKKQDKKKSPTKSKPRRPRSRVTNVGSDSDSESEISGRNRIQVAR